jgi:hypothetical protein
VPFGCVPGVVCGLGALSVNLCARCVLFHVVRWDVLQIAWAKQAEPSLFLFNPAIHAGASDVTPRRTC